MPTQMARQVADAFVLPCLVAPSAHAIGAHTITDGASGILTINLRPEEPEQLLEGVAEGAHAFAFKLSTSE